MTCRRRLGRKSAATSPPEIEAESGDGPILTTIEPARYSHVPNDTFRDECLIAEWFRTRPEAAVVVEAWRRPYDEARAHSSLVCVTPRKGEDRSQSQQLRERPFDSGVALQ